MGDKLPKIKLEDQEGAEVDVSTLVSDDTGIVIFLYPKVSLHRCSSV
jgi:peroxiredoxin Q/BCP